MIIRIEDIGNGEGVDDLNVTEVEKQNVFLPVIRCVSASSGEEYTFYVAASREQAGKAARDYWKDMARRDPEEFAFIVGPETLAAWSRGEFAGPGRTHVKSLNEWLDLHLDAPEETFATRDRKERRVAFADDDLIEVLGFVPRVAYQS